MIAGADTVADLRAAPVGGRRARRRAAAADDARAQGRADRRLGVEELVVIPFDREFAARSAAGLHRRRARRRARATHVCVGENFRFGHKAPGDADAAARRRALRDAGRPAARGRRRGRAPPATSAAWCSAARSSTPAPARRAVHGRRARSSHGDERGRTLGFPTANLVPRDGFVDPGPRRLRLPRATADGAIHAAAVNVGVRPMFVTGRGELIEAYLLDFDGDLYGTAAARWSSSSACAARSASPSVDALSSRWRRDVEQARAIAARERPLLPSRAAHDPDAGAQGRAHHRSSAPDAQDTGNTRVQVALLTERINELTEHLRDPQEGPPLAPRAADARRPAPPAAQLPAAQATSRATARSSRSSACAGEHRRARAPGARLHAPPRGRQVHPRGPARAARPSSSSTRSPSARSAPTSCRSTTRRSTTSRAQGATLYGVSIDARSRRRPSASSSASRSSSCRTSSPRARPSRAFGAYFEPAG